jgi:hypothetical protein
MTTYLAIAGLNILITLLLLLVTKRPAVVASTAAVLSAALVVLYARIDLGYWDPFAEIAFVTILAYTLVVSFVVIWLGRLLGWKFFVRRANSS